MTTNVIMPVLGMVQDTGKIVRWLKNLGEPVRQGEILLEVETDKAVQELESPATGILTQILANEGDEVPVTQVVAVILTPAEYQTTPAPNETSFKQPVSHGAEAPSKVVDAFPSKDQSPLISLPASSEQHYGCSNHIGCSNHYGRILASPKARRLAQEAHLNLADLHGSGPDGAILARDLDSHAVIPTEVQVPAQADLPVISTQKPSEEIPLASHPNTTRPSWQPRLDQTPPSSNAVQPFSLHYGARVNRLLAWHTLLQQTSKGSIMLTDLLVLIASRALTRNPKINAIWQDEKTSISEEINISLTLALDDGWADPVIHHADRLTASEIAKERQELVTRAQSGILRGEDISGGTFTISHLDMEKVDSYTAVLNQSQAAGLAVGRITEQVIPLNGAPEIQPILNLSVSFDPRQVDGVRAAKFLETLAELIEEPILLLT